MILKSFVLGNRLSLCMKILNSVVVVGLYYGLLITLSIGPSYLFLLRALVVMEKGDKGIQKKVSATTGLITGQLMMFISIYYAPLRLALGRPHTITVLTLSYLLSNFFWWNNNKQFWDSGSTTRNAMRNLSIQCVFLNHFIGQLFNQSRLPSSMVARLVNIYMFRCNNKMLFVTSSFVGWLIGHILFMKWVGLVLVWIHSIRWDKYIRRFNKELNIRSTKYLNNIRSNTYFKKSIRSTNKYINKYIINKNKYILKYIIYNQSLNKSRKYLGSELKNLRKELRYLASELKYLASELRNYPARIFSILLLIICVYDLGRIPPPFSTKKLKESSNSKREERRESQEETASETKGTKQEQEGYTEEDPSPSPFSEEKEDPDQKDEKQELFRFEKLLVTPLFDYNRWTRPFRYIRNDRFLSGQAVRNEMSQYFFYTCRSDGKQRISFTYPPSLSTFLEMIEKRISLSTLEKPSSEKLNSRWVYTNKQKSNNLNNEFLNRMKALRDKGVHPLDTLEKRTRLCKYDDRHPRISKRKYLYLPKMYDPFLNGPYRGTINERVSPSIRNETSIKNFIKIMGINQIHAILLSDTDYKELKQKINTFDKKTLSTEMSHFFTLINQFAREAKSSLNSIRKKVPRWPYKLITEVEQLAADYTPEDHQMRSRRAKRVVIFTQYNPDPTVPVQEVALIRYSAISDFRRNLIKGSMRTQRRKIGVWKIFQTNAHSPLFLDRINRFPFILDIIDLIDDISEMIKPFFKQWMGKGEEFNIVDYTEEQTEKKEKDKKEDTAQMIIERREEEEEREQRRKDARRAISENWDDLTLGQALRGCLLITQSVLRKYIIFPSLIIAKNIGRVLLFQRPEWSEDLQEWKREIHIKCTYDGVQLSETEFPRNWLIEGIQIKILFPFYLKPWHRSKRRSSRRDLMKTKMDSCFLTVWGRETERPLGFPQKRPSFFKPVFKELKKQFKKKSFQFIRDLKGRRTKLLLAGLKETKKWVIENVLFIIQNVLVTTKKKKGLSKVNPSLLVRLREVYESIETQKEKDSIIINQIIPESFSQIGSADWTNSSPTEKKMKDLADRKSTIRNQLERITKETTKVTPERNINMSPNKTSYNAKRLESPKKIWQISKRRNARLICQLHYFIKLLIERIYTYIFLCIINILRINTQLFLESKKKMIEKSIYNNEKNQEKMNKTNQKKMHFISFIFISFISTIKEKMNKAKKMHFISTLKKKESLKKISNRKTNSHSFCDLSSLSQAYVFYKLSQTQVINLDKLRAVLNYHGTSFFLKTEIKDSFGTQGIFHYELRHKKPQRYGMNRWKNWLRGHYQYDLSQIRWSRLIPKKWRNRVNRRRTAQKQNQYLTKGDSYKKEPLIHYKKQNDSQIYSVPKQKDNFQKCYKYEFFSYESIHYENKRGLSIYESKKNKKGKWSFLWSFLKNKRVSYNYNTQKHKLLDMLGDIPINNYLAKGHIMYKKPDRRYFHWQILDFSIREKADIEAWTKLDTNSTQNTQIGTNNYQIIQKVNKKNIFYLRIHQDPEINPPNPQKRFLDWMGMNEEILNHPISNWGPWFLPELVLLENSYQMRPWVIPDKLLFVNINIINRINRNENIGEKKKKKINFNRKLKGSFLISSNFEFKNRNQDEKEPVAGQGDLVQNPENLESLVSIHKKDMEEDSVSIHKKGMEEDSVGSDTQKKKYNSSGEAELDSFVKCYLICPLRWYECLKQTMIHNIEVYCLLVRLKEPKRLTLSLLEREELRLDIMQVQKILPVAEWVKTGVLILEPPRLSVKNDGQFLMYQTIGISFVHNSKYPTNLRLPVLKYYDRWVGNKTCEDYSTRHKRIIGRINKNHYDLLVPENLLSSRRRRELRILICFNSKNRNPVENGGGPFYEVMKYKFFLWLMKYKFFLWLWPNYRFLDKGKHRDKNEEMKYKFFLWPNYRLEDLACMNRYWFDTNNGSRFSMLRLHMYPRLKIR